ncbi:MAG: ComEC/Rec2 family competence protein [Anaerolineales bacterium]
MTPLLLFTLAWASGILLAHLAFFPLIWLLLLLPLAMVLFIGWRDATWARRAALIALGVLLGAGRIFLAQPQINPEHIAFYAGASPGPVEVVGVVIEPPERHPRQTDLVIQAEQLTLPSGAEAPVGGRLMVKAPAYTPAHYGDRIYVVGAVESPPVFAEFSYRAYLARQGIYALMRGAEYQPLSSSAQNSYHAYVEILESHQASPFKDALFRFREHALHTIHTLLPEPQSSLLAGILLGIETGISDELGAAFSATGTTHIIAISGFNLSIIAGVFAAIANRLLGRRGEVLVALGGVWIYTVLVGASAAVVRAAVMASVAVLARHEGRGVHGPTSLASAAFLMSLHNPYVLWDVGFQLSLAATMGLILYTDPLTESARRWLTQFIRQERAEQILGLLSDALLVTLAAQITTTPIIVATFGRLSLVTLITNILILPVQSFVMLWGALALLGGLIIRPLGQIFSWLAWAFLTYTIEMVRWTARAPRASIALEGMTAPLVFGYYAALFGGTWWRSLPRAKRRRWWGQMQRAAQWQIAAGGAVVALSVIFFTAMPDGRLHVHILDVGQGDAIFIQTPHGRQILIDGGPDAPQTLSRVGRRMPFWDRSLDMAALTSPDEERLAGLIPVLERYRVDFVSVGPETGSGNLYETWERLLEERPSDTVGHLSSGMSWQLDQDVALRTLWPDVSATGPLVLQIVYGETSILLPGDATTLVEEALVTRHQGDLRSTVLLAPRHGDATAATPAFLQAVAPEVAVISVGADTWGRYPAPAVLARLMDVPVYRTDQDGTIEIVSDGEKIEVKTER